MKKYMLNSLGVVPPGGWRWKCPLHGTEFKAENFPQLWEKVGGYLKANRMEMPEDPVVWLQDATCRQNDWGPETCYTVDVSPTE